MRRSLCFCGAWLPSTHAHLTHLCREPTPPHWACLHTAGLHLALLGCLWWKAMDEQRRGGKGGSSSWALKSERAESKYELHCILVIQAWATHLTFLCLSFLIYKVEIIKLTLKYRLKMLYVKQSVLQNRCSVRKLSWLFPIVWPVAPPCPRTEPLMARVVRDGRPLQEPERRSFESALQELRSRIPTRGQASQ